MGFKAQHAQVMILGVVETPGMGLAAVAQQARSPRLSLWLRGKHRASQDDAEQEHLTWMHM